jgi:DNA-binding NtrC family response regulator
MAILQGSAGDLHLLLVAQDNPARRWAAAYLRQAGFVVVEVRSAIEALYLINRYAFTMVFAEVKSPTTRAGFNLAWHVNRCRPATAIILCRDSDILIEQVREWVCAPCACTNLS